MGNDVAKGPIMDILLLNDFFMSVLFLLPGLHFTCAAALLRAGTCTLGPCL